MRTNKEDRLHHNNGNTHVNGHDHSSVDFTTRKGDKVVGLLRNCGAASTSGE